MNRRFGKWRHTFLSKSGKFIYHISIIDYLQDFNFEKKFENKFKVLINKEGAQISAIEPKGYMTRYMRFMKEKVFIDQRASNKDEWN